MKHNIRKIIILSLLLCFGLPQFAQELTQKEFIKIVHNADNHFYYNEDYEKASALYETINNAFPENCNIAAKLGICYLNIDGKEQDALKLLTYASNNIVASDNEYIEYGEKAPLDTYLYLAIAYHRNDSLKKAVSYYQNAKKIAEATNIFREDFIDNQIRNCKYAMEMEQNPTHFDKQLLFPWLKDYKGARNPVLSNNDSIFIFTQQKNGENQIYCSYKTKSWNKPVDITKQLGGYNKMYPNSITGNGKILIVYLDEGGDGNLYYSYRKGSSWTKLKSLGKTINTIYWEAHGFITPDGNTLFFASNRPEGYGELDIWKSQKSDKGSWGKPENCGKVINTPYNENTPFYDAESGSLLFSSMGHISMGGYDVFRSTLKDDRWSNPIGLPYSYNTTTDNLFFIPGREGKEEYITSQYDHHTLARNIYAIEPEKTSVEKILLKGSISLNDGMPVDPDNTQIQLIDHTSGKTIERIPLKSGKPVFESQLNQGEYYIVVHHPGYKTDTTDLYIAEQNNLISVNISLTADKVHKGTFLTIQNIFFDFDSYSFNKEAIKTLQRLKTILEKYPDLKIEIAGYTDSKGTAKYNLQLANKRANAVIEYFTSSGIPEARFIKHVFGESNFASINTNKDGTDNPEGRKYNRRVAFGIIDSHTGVVISHETYTPEHLRQPYSLKYSIVVKKSPVSIPPDNLDVLGINKIHFFKTIEIDSSFLYTVGIFYNYNDASKYLEYVINKGFRDAYIVKQSEIYNESETLTDPSFSRQQAVKPKYTIQLKAARIPISKSRFKNVEGVTEIYSGDGYYRYIIGKFNSFSKAKDALAPYIESGYKDAFIRDLNLLIDGQTEL